MTDYLEIVDRLVVLLKMMVHDSVSVSATVIPDNVGAYTIRFSVPQNEIERVSGIEERTMRSLRVIANAMGEKSESRFNLDTSWR